MKKNPGRKERRQSIKKANDQEGRKRMKYQNWRRKVGKDTKEE